MYISIIFIHVSLIIVDSIEANVERAYTNVDQGTQQLGKAAEYQVGYLP